MRRNAHTFSSAAVQVVSTHHLASTQRQLAKRMTEKDDNLTRMTEKNDKDDQSSANFSFEINGWNEPHHLSFNGIITSINV